MIPQMTVVGDLTCGEDELTVIPDYAEQKDPQTMHNQHLLLAGLRHSTPHTPGRGLLEPPSASSESSDKSNFTHSKVANFRITKRGTLPQQSQTKEWQVMLSRQSLANLKAQPSLCVPGHRNADLPRQSASQT